tara:strand:+ start:257 stop:547 length:291 start_codon:yes stop_codon:yes gene_type:complete
MEKSQPIKIEEKNDTKAIDAVMSQLLKMGGLRVENIIELQYILKLIHEGPLALKEKQNCGNCLNMIITLANLYLENHKDNDYEVVKSYSSDEDHDL